MFTPQDMSPYRPLIITIILSTVVVVSAMGYFKHQLASRPDETRVIALIDKHLQENNKRLDDYASQLEKYKNRELSDKEFNARVERGIDAYVEKKRREAQERPDRLARNVPPPTKDDHIYGNASAPVSLIEYADFECPYCKRFHDTTKQLVDRSNGQINLVYRHFPLSFHNPGSEKESEASECVAKLGGNASFWKFSDGIYARTHSNGHGFPIKDLAPLAVSLGVDRKAFIHCLNSGRMQARIKHDQASGARSGVEGTPGNILRNNRTGKVKAMPGVQSYAALSQAAEKLLKTR